MLRKIKKGLTLLELVIAMALSSLVIVGATTIFVAMNRMSDAETRSFTESTNVKQLITTIDSVLGDHENDNISLNSEETFPNPLFTITKDETQIEYSFENKELSKTTSGNKETIFTVTYDVRISLSVYSAGSSIYKFTFEYGKDFAKSMYLLKKVN